MSVSSQPVEAGNWKPTACEIAELLLSLGISPPESLDEYIPTSLDSCRNSTPHAFTELDELEDPGNLSRSLTPPNKDFDREITIEHLQAIREEGRFERWRNNLFHEHLVEHFKRKQMMHVCTDESEDDVLLNEYLKKLDELERSNEELRKSREEWDIEFSRAQENIRRKKREAREAVEEMVTKERAVGTSTWSCGKPLGFKRVQALITRQLDRIRDIANFRLRYTRLRDELISRQVELSAAMVLSPNLTKEDYERLEAEQFYYKRELRSKEAQREGLTKRRGSLINRIDGMRRRIVKISREIDDCERTIDALRDSVKLSLAEKKIWLTKLIDARRFIREFHEVIGRSTRPEFASSIADIRAEHEDWMRIISKTLKDIKALGQSLNAIRTNLILHGKDLERSASSSDLKSVSRTPSVNRDDEDLQ